MTDKSHAGEITQQYLPVDIYVFRSAMRDIEFDVYLKVSDDNFAHVFSKTTGLDYRRLAQYIQKGVKQLYIRQEDDASFKEYLSKPAESILVDPNTSAEKRIATLLNMTEQNMSEIFTQLSVLEETAGRTQKVVQNYVNLMAESPKTLAIILKLASHGEYLYFHSIAVAIFSIFIAKATGQFNQRMLEIIGMGGFLHDIGCAQLSKGALESPNELTPTQWKEMLTHPKLGLQMIENTPNIPDEVRYIVYQHHEEPGGQGYPNGLRDQVIYYPAKIVAVADAFSALISRRPYRQAYSVEQAVHIMQAEARKYDPELVKLVSTIFLKKAAGTGSSAA